MMNIFETVKLGFDKTKVKYEKNKPLVLMIFACGCSVLSTFEAYKQAPKIKDGLDEAIDEFKKAQTTKEKVVAVVDGVVDVGVPLTKVVLPEAIAIYSMNKSYKESTARLLTMAGIAATSKMELKDFKEAAKEVVGQKKVDQIEEKTAEKQFDELKKHNKVIEDYDSDSSNPDTIHDVDTGAVWHDRYINVLDAVSAYFTEAKTGDRIFYPIADLYDKLNYGKNGNSIRIGKMLHGFGVYQDDLQNVKSVQDFYKVVQAGPNYYKLVRQVPLRANPDTWCDEVSSYYDGTFTDGIDSGYDEPYYGNDNLFGDGEWNGSLNPELRA